MPPNALSRRRFLYLTGAMAAGAAGLTAHTPLDALASDHRASQVSITFSSWAFFYNREWFEKKGIPADRSHFPKTWDELRKLSKEFTHWKGDTLVTAGYVPFRFTQDWDIPPTMYIWSVLNGGQLYDP